MATTYQPPIWSEHSISAVRSNDTAFELDKIQDEQEAQGIHPPTVAEAIKEQEEKGFKQSTIIVIAFAGVSVISSIVTIWTQTIWIADFANLFPLFTAPYVAVVRHKLAQMPSLREVHNKLRLRVNEMSMENRELETSNTKLEAQVLRINEVENRLQEVAAKSGRDANELMDLVEENGSIIRKMKELQEAQVMTECLRALINCDSSQDGNIDENEMNMLIMRLKCIPGVNLSERRLRAAFRVQHSNSLRTVIAVTKKILREDQLQIAKQGRSIRQSMILRKSAKLGYVNMS